METQKHIPIAIIGSGFAGLGMAIRLKEAGIEDFVIFERAEEVGGTWRDNTYPGCACDIESDLYSYSFAPNPNWSRTWSPQPEILAYLRSCATRFGVHSHIKFRQNLEKAIWDDASKQWQLTISGYPFTCQVLISCMGALTEPLVPALRGLEQFRGKIFHSARWDKDHKLAGRKVAVLGTGASAIQFIPEIQPVVEQLYVFQRTPAWILPSYNPKLSESKNRRFSAFPLLQKLSRLRFYLLHESMGIAFRFPLFMKHFEKFAKNYLRRKVADSVLRAKLTPNYAMGCKRILISSRYYPAIQSHNVEVIAEAVEEIRPNSVVTSEGKEREVDTIILGTGFRLSDMHSSKELLGRNGQTLLDYWQGSPKAHLGTTIADFPNLFFVFGPNTGLGHNSVILMAESQMTYIRKAIQWMRKMKVASLEPRPESQAAFNRVLDRKMINTVWNSGCKSWYLDGTGRNSLLWPGSVGSFRRRLVFKPAEFIFSSR